MVARRGLVLVWTLVLWLIPVAANALENEAPAVVLPGANAYRNVAETGDLLVIVLYALPGEGTGSWDEIGADGALLRLRFNGELLQERAPRRTGYAVSGFYLAPGHGVPFATNTLDVLLFSNPALFITNSSTSAEVVFPPGDSDSASTLVTESPTRQSAICSRLQTTLISVEQNDPNIATNNLVSAQQLITGAGTSMVQDAIGVMPLILPDCFEQSIEGAGGSFDPNDPTTRDDRQTAAEGTAFYQAIIAMLAFWGITGTAATAAIIAMFGGFAVLVMGLLMIWPGSYLFAIPPGGLIMFMGGLQFPSALLGLVFMLALVAAMGGIFFAFKWFPR